ncbi:MAG: NADH-quinone oxidoreductase subunit M [Acidobacteria bacterium]|nr:MAG: NADH-quinone oxidoreductase subunit M [Acidobacteriota bacterium]REK03118.1 MAG: NADH-quinone oxidoreductase subunit M [Acidobacteriota bacterium]REK15465.1 MAG: NADH-quinone oxidoreductase subunit M [Acidobacteriota bacterium]REK45816.1 MAG: NADH-quinone oxidoreductase subunit M [Acidobacteriota bacterium]
MNQYLLTILILVPVIGTAAIIAHQVFWKDESHLKWLTLGVTVITFLLSLLLLGSAQASANGFYFEQNTPWIEAIGTNYHIGVDGLSLWLVLLTTFIMPIAVISTWHAIEKRPLAFYAFMLLLESAMIGVFVSLDLLVFYLFFEASLVPMFFLIGIWGGKQRIYAAVKFFIYTALGSLLMLVAIIALYYLHLQATGIGTFDYVTLLGSLTAGKLTFAGSSAYVGTLLFLAFALAFSIKVPVFPFHTWLPDAHTEAPTAGSVILAAILLKMGTYGMMRFNFTLFPEASRELAWVFIILAIIGITYGALVAMVQPDVKRLVAYSSVAHMGFVVLGMFSFTEQGMQGALYTMLAHGVTTGALFLLVGFIYERRHTREISEYGGLSSVMPIYSTVFVITAMASVGLPFLNGFVGEFLIMLGMWSSTILPGSWNQIATMAAGTGVIFAAVYLLWMIQRVFFGKVTNEKNKSLRDLDLREIGLMAPLLFLMVFMGVYPKPILDSSKPSVVAIQQIVNGETRGGTITELNTEGTDQQ